MLSHKSNNFTGKSQSRFVENIVNSPKWQRMERREVSDINQNNFREENGYDTLVHCHIF